MRLGRRALLACAAAAVVLPLAPARAAPFAPPDAPMRYTRRLERGLPGGARLVVTRSFAIRFVPVAGGFRVDGEQVAVSVEAPEQLESLAQLERERRETGLFPLRLDPAGAIEDDGGGRGEAGGHDAAMREVLARIDGWNHAPAERAALRAFVDAVHRSAGEMLTRLPRDLFAPREPARSERRALALADGEAGEVRMTFAAERDPATGLMRSATREVVTEVAGEVRRTLETWRLEPVD